MNLRSKAGKTCELFKSKLSFNPYKLVGIVHFGLNIDDLYDAY